MENNISVRIHIQRKPNYDIKSLPVKWEYEVEGVMPHFGWEGQIDTEIVVFDKGWSPCDDLYNTDNVCEDYKDCYAGTEPHQHLYNSTAVIRSTGVEEK
tara:strand:+ start:90 stop:386 length:297 start_codon:yes stop_codon:yes gene_type:complete